MADLFIIVFALTLLATIIGMIVKMYLENTKEEREYKRIAKKTRNKRKEFEERKRKQFENNKLDKEWVGMEDNKNDKKYIIEIKSGLYVSTNAFGNVYSFTKNIEEAIKTSYLDSARDIAERCYGTVKEYRMKHEILEVVE